MKNTLVVGLQYGDEGKGRVSAYFMKDHEWNIRFNGGPNAGHTVYHEGQKYSLHHLPAGAVQGKKVALHAGMVINPDTFIEECEKLNWRFPLFISSDVHLISEDHLERDSSGSGIGSTKRGIAYVYSDRALRRGKRVAGSNEFVERLKGHGNYLCVYKGMPPVESNESALLESAQGLMLDVDYGSYPYVTSSNVLPSVAHKVGRTIGVMKAYTSRVGDGPPYYDDNEGIRNAGSEFGTTTGRPRKCTWVDLDELNYSMSIVQPDEVVVTKLDVLSGMNIGVYKSGELYSIGSLDNYKSFLVETFPSIKYFSESPDGDLIKVK
jgi:adenylosuccinate synthase